MKWHCQWGRGGSWGWLWKWTSSGIFLSKQVASIVIYCMKGVPSTLYLVAEGMWLWARLILEILWMKNLELHALSVQTWPLLLVGGSKSGPWILKQEPVWVKHAAGVLSTETGVEALLRSPRRTDHPYLPLYPYFPWLLGHQTAWFFF